MLHQKYHLIIHNLSSSIVTVKDQSISYFNRSGEDILRANVQKIADQDLQQSCDTVLSKLSSDIQSLKPTELSTKEPDCPHKLILEKPLLKAKFKDDNKLPVEDQKTYALVDLELMNNDELQKLTFQKAKEEMHPDQEDQQQQNESRDKYFKVEVSKLKIGSSTYSVIRINDVTINMLFDFSKGEKRILQLINACVSHEMRNPLNAIMSQNLLVKNIATRLQLLLRTNADNPLAAQL